MSGIKIRVKLRDNSTSLKRGKKDKLNFIKNNEIKIVDKNDEFIKACLKTKVLQNLGEVIEQKSPPSDKDNKKDK